MWSTSLSNWYIDAKGVTCGMIEFTQFISTRGKMVSSFWLLGHGNHHCGRRLQTDNVYSNGFQESPIRCSFDSSSEQLLIGFFSWSRSRRAKRSQSIKACWPRKSAITMSKKVKNAISDKYTLHWPFVNTFSYVDINHIILKCSMLASPQYNKY